MGRLIYSMLVSQDGYVADAEGDFGWGEPDEEVLAEINRELSGVGTYLYGRRIYELMSVWETDPSLAESSPENARFADIWQQTDKVVYSRTLDEVATSRTRLVREFDPVEVRRMKSDTDRDLSINGPTLAAEAFRHGLVDRVSVLLCPQTLGGGLAFWPPRRLSLRLHRVERFDSGVVALGYDVVGP